MALEAICLIALENSGFGLSLKTSLAQKMGYIRGMEIKHCSAKKLDNDPDMGAHAAISAPGSWKQYQDQEFTAILSFIASLKAAWII